MNGQLGDERNWTYGRLEAYLKQEIEFIRNPRGPLRPEFRFFLLEPLLGAEPSAIPAVYP